MVITASPTPSEAPHHESSSDAVPEHLHLVSVLTSGLPAEVGTRDEPRVYTVPAVFSRQVAPQEKARIEDPAVARRLADEGFPGVELTVSDRRLLIRNTNLAALRDGLARRIAAVLRDVGRELAEKQVRLDDERGARQRDEQQRVDAVSAAAAEIRFE